MRPIKVAVDRSLVPQRAAKRRSEVLHEVTTKAMQFRYPESSPTPYPCSSVAINSIAFFCTGAIRSLQLNVGISDLHAMSIKSWEIVLLLF
jgi:hypothetical protein